MKRTPARQWRIGPAPLRQRSLWRHPSPTSRLSNPNGEFFRNGRVMPATYRLDPERRLVVITLAGVVTGAELDEVRTQIREDPAFDPSFSVLVDASELNPAALTGQVVRARAAAPPPGRMRVAVVAPADAVFGIARMYQMMVEGSGKPVGVFRSTDEAMAWLASPGPAR